MALRLTPTSLSPDRPGSAPDAGRDLAVELSGRASALLLAGEYAQYLELFERAAAHPDPNRRYHAERALIESGFAAAAQTPAARGVSLFLAIAEAAVRVLEREPREPVILNYTGVALYELWSLDAARALFQAAQRLDPSLPHLRRNLAEVGRRRRGSSRRPLHHRLPELARRAKRAATLARPATGLKLSLCMIVRDEEEMLPRCLEAVAPAVDEIIVVDTGSVDRTIEIARSFGAQVIEREWTGSFSDARNASFEAATGDWVMYLDADEVLVAEDVDKLRALTGRTWREAFYLTETNYTGDADDGTAVTHNALRVFRNRPEYRFEGRLHEQIAQHLPAYVSERIEPTAVRIEHYGYLGAVRDAKEKSRRNIELLLAQQAESAPSPFLHFNLGSEYAAAGDAPAALREFERSWQLIEEEGEDGQHEFTPSLVVRLVKALRCCGRSENALARAEEGLRLFPGFTDLVFEQATASLALGRREQAITLFERCIEMGDAPAQYTATVGCGTYLPRITLAELKLKQGDADGAVELLRWCIEHHPGFFGVVLPYATALMRSGSDGDAVIAEIERHVPRMTATVRFQLGTGLYEAGAVAASERLFRQVLADQPHSGSARVALTESLLAQRRNEEAAAEAAAMPEDDPLAAIAIRSELFGRIVGGDLDGATAACERAARVGLPAPELELFTAWLGLLRGEGVARPVAIGAMRLLGLILEALLRVQDFTAFEAAQPLLAGSELPPREQRELLAGMYLRRGFLASAAEEWMTVCQQQPDARALVGLARVAAAHGLPEDAATFAGEALALEPGNREARQLLEWHRPAVLATR